MNEWTARPRALYAGREVYPMSLFEFLERLEVDPFDPALYALFGVEAPEDSEDETEE